ncbi:MAG TPA: hypothetical protein VJT31_26330, partial [Rugosimonospora sp.]|nr:hypothetical protein [Rugosimonospora sp.]
MDFTQLQALTRHAGLRVHWTALLRLAGRYPEQALDWVAAAGQYAAAHTGCQLLTTATADLRDRIAATDAEQLYQFADELSRVCDLLTESQQAHDEARDRFVDRCHELAALDPTAMLADTDEPDGNPSMPP